MYLDAARVSLVDSIINAMLLVTISLEKSSFASIGPDSELANAVSISSTLSEL